MSVSKDGYDLSKIDPSVELNKTTLKDLRAMLGTPTFIATEKNNGEVVGFAFVGHNLGAVSAREFGRMMLSLGFAADKWEVTEKVAVFKLDKKGVVTDYQKGGASFLYRSRLTSWNECERKLTPEEINSKANYMSLEAALSGIPSDLHPGAARYFAEQGIEIPDYLK
jgi:hypothetical protein